MPPQEQNRIWEDMLSKDIKGQSEMLSQSFISIFYGGCETGQWAVDFIREEEMIKNYQGTVVISVKQLTQHERCIACRSFSTGQDENLLLVWSVLNECHMLI